jgi:predicted dehydrogenase
MKHYDIVGCGSVVRRYHAPILRSFIRRRDIRIHGCYDLNVEAAKEMGSSLGAERTGTPDQLGDLSGVDAVLIATPPESHAEFIERYASLGKAVLVEKPFVGTRTEAERVIQLSRSRNAPVLVGHFRRYYPALEIARIFIAEGGLGRVRRVEATEGGRWAWPTFSRYVIESPLGGVIHDTGSHLMDMVLYVLEADCGPELPFMIIDVARIPDAEPSHACRAQIQLGNAELGTVDLTFAVSRLEPLAGAIKVYGDRGTMIVPTAFASAPFLVQGSEPFAIRRPQYDTGPTDAIGCFLLEHRAFLEAEPGPLAADRFLTLTALLESLGTVASPVS